MKTDIIVLGYKIPEVEERCFSSVIRGTDPGTYVFTFMDNFHGVTLTYAWNKFISQSRCPYICLLNSDTEVYPNWLNKLIAPLEDSSKKIGFTGPSTNNCHSPQRNIGSYGESLKHIGEVEIMKDPISGFCVVFKRKIWEDLNGFDERYKFYGAESDFIDRASKIGYQCAWVKDAYVYHIGERSIRAAKLDVDFERKKARELYWSTRKK